MSGSEHETVDDPRNNPRRQDRLRTLYEQAVERPEAEWEAFLQRACSESLSLREEVMNLLRASLQAEHEGFLERTEDELPPRVTDAEHLGKYQVVRRLSETPTGQGVAFLAFDPDTDRHVVLKRYYEGASTGAIAEEARALARVANPYVARCYGVDRIADEAYLVAEYAPGRSLTDLRSEAPLEPRRAIEIVARLAEGVAAVHARGLIHRDIKPANVILQDDGAPRLVDFGIAAHLGGKGLEGVSGSPPYMAPEQARGESDRLDFRTDIYGLGAVLYELLTGRPPHTGQSRSEVLEHARKGVIQPPRALNPNIPKRLEAVCLKALAPAPEQRYASADTFREALLDALPNRTRRRRIFAVSAAGLGFAAAGLLLVIWGPDRNPAPPREPPRPRPPDQADAPAGPTKPAPALRVLDLEIEHRPKLNAESYDVKRAGLIGERSFVTRFDDEVAVRAELSEPAYAYLIAFAPDGSIHLCDPLDETRPPPLSDRPALPSDPTSSAAYRLNDGVGLHAFAVVASQEPLPAFREWLDAQGRPPWPEGDVPGAPGLVRTADGRWLQGPNTLASRNALVSRGVVNEARRASGAGAVVEDLERWLQTRPEVDAVTIEAFTVEASEPREE